jgi:hypothetical protein
VWAQTGKKICLMLSMSVLLVCCIVGCGAVRVKPKPPTRGELLRVAVYGSALATGGTKVDMRSGKLEGIGHYVEREGFKHMEVDISASDLRKLRELINGSGLHDFAPRWEWFERAAKEYKSKRPRSHGDADWAYMLEITWEGKRVAFNSMPRDMRKYLSADASRKYERMDMVLGEVLGLAHKYSRTGKLVGANKRAMNQMGLEADRVAKRSLPKW